MPNSPINEEQRWLIINALRVAVEQYQRDAQAEPALAQEFIRQAEQVEELASSIESASAIEIRT